MRRLRLLTAGESHGPGMSGILEGLPGRPARLDRPRSTATSRAGSTATAAAAAC